MMRDVTYAPIHKRLSKLPVAIITINQSGFITQFNKQAAFVSQLSQDECLNVHYKECFGRVSIIENYISNKAVHEDTVSIIINNIPVTLHILCIDEFTKDLVCMMISKQNPNNYSDRDHIFFEQMLDVSLDEIFITDGEGTILFVNAAAESLYGESAQNIIGKCALQLEKEGYFSPALFPIVKEKKEKVSMIQKTRTGKKHHVIAQPSFNKEGELISVIFNARDISEIKGIDVKKQLKNTEDNGFDQSVDIFSDKNKYIAQAPQMLKLKNTVDKVAPLDTTILITGESGVGKGVLVSDIHRKSIRNNKPLIHINCGAIPESLIESELFGYAKGAFTGANQQGHKGLIEQANGGTLFLDEIGEMPLQSQVKLLKFIQDGKIQPIGSSEVIYTDVRIISATNKNLQDLVKEGLFRMDLYYRLNVIPIHIPALRERPEDISYLLHFFLQKFNHRYTQTKYFDKTAENVFYKYSWPGNVRELENVIERLVITADNEKISVEDLPVDILENGNSKNYVTVHDIISLKKAQEELEKQLILKAYEIDPSSYKVAELLKINQSTAHRKIKKYLQV